MSNELIKYAWIEPETNRLIVTMIEDYTEEIDEPFNAYQFSYPIAEIKDTTIDRNQKVEDFIVDGGSEDHKFISQVEFNEHIETLKGEMIYIFEDKSLTIQQMTKLLMNTGAGIPNSILLDRYKLEI